MPRCVNTLQNTKENLLSTGRRTGLRIPTVPQRLYSIEVFQNSFLVGKIANFPNFPKHMDECIHLIGGLLGYVYKYDPFKHVQMLNMSNEWLVLFQ